VRGQRHAPAAPYPRERPGTHCTGGWVDLRAGLDSCGKSRPTGIRSSDCPARRQSLYRLRYPAHFLYNMKECKLLIMLQQLLFKWPQYFCMHNSGDLNDNLFPFLQFYHFPLCS